jgi:hypothetical protein
MLMENAAALGLARQSEEGRAAQVEEILRYSQLRRESNVATLRPMLPTIAVVAPIFAANGDSGLRILSISLLPQLPADQLHGLGKLAPTAAEQVTTAIGGRFPSALRTSAPVLSRP